MIIFDFIKRFSSERPKLNHRILLYEYSYIRGYVYTQLTGDNNNNNLNSHRRDNFVK